MEIVPQRVRISENEVIMLKIYYNRLLEVMEDERIRLKMVDSIISTILKIKVIKENYYNSIIKINELLEIFNPLDKTCSILFKIYATKVRKSEKILPNDENYKTLIYSMLENLLQINESVIYNISIVECNKLKLVIKVIDNILYHTNGGSFAVVDDLINSLNKPYIALFHSVIKKSDE